MTTPPTSPRAVAESFCYALQTHNLDALFALAAPDATWWVVGRPELGSRYGGQRPFSDRRTDAERNMSLLKQSEFVVVDITVGEQTTHAGEKSQKGDQSDEGYTKVVIEGVLQGKSATGIPYRNDILVVLTVQRGKIIAIREWLDAKEIEVFFEAVKQEK